MIYQCFHPETGKKTAQALLDIHAIKLSPENPFTWASGWKSPIYCDNRLSLSYPAVRNAIKESFAELIRHHFPEAEAIAGVATAGIPQGVLVADVLGLPFLYVRAKSKSHGLANQIEGRYEKGMKVVVLEDLVSTGGSSLAAVDALRDAGVDVQGMTCIFTYGFPQAEENFRAKKVDLVYLSEYSLLLSQALSQGAIGSSEMDTLNEWRQDPAAWNQ
ncbi:MAG: orotate phosphoribosyltransferase [Cyclobacteriaceae bacterium]|nr:orotate phosphoribosyltransferase [Cyclobacteriaceae bacterium]